MNDLNYLDIITHYYNNSKRMQFKLFIEFKDDSSLIIFLIINYSIRELKVIQTE